MMINLPQFQAAVRFVAENNHHYTQRYHDEEYSRDTEGVDTEPDDRPYSELTEFEKKCVQGRVAKSIIATTKSLLDRANDDEYIVMTGGYCVLCLEDEIEILVDPSTGDDPDFVSLTKAGLNALMLEGKGLFR
jgi:hypothetical protein